MSKARKSGAAGNPSVDSFTSSMSTTIANAARDMILDSSTSVQSAVAFDSLAIAMHRFPSKRKTTIGREARIKRYVYNLIVRYNEEESRDGEWSYATGGVKSSSSSRKSGQQVTEASSSLSVSSPVWVRKVVPPASLLRPPRGNLICAMKDLDRELMSSLRDLPRGERSALAARLIRTLDPSCPSHSDIAQKIFFISTL